jgi:hypothetical protein
MKRDSNVRKRVLCALLAGPKRPSQIPVNLGSAVTALKRYKEQGIVRKMGTARIAPWSLTEKGVPIAARYDYELKLKNAHPEQITKVYPLKDKVSDPVEEISDHFDTAIFKEEYKQNIPESVTVVEPVDWRQRHVEFLEEIVRNLTTKQ